MISRNNINHDSESLFLVVLGGRAKNSHIELHDVRWVVGKKIEDTFHQLRSQWFGRENGLHIDSYVKIRFVDGYIVNLKPEKIRNKEKTENKLWFINIGGYDANKLLEEHQFGLIVAGSAYIAKKKAKKLWLKDKLQKHNDDTSCLSEVKGIDNCHSISRINNWSVNLMPDRLGRSQSFIPDWYGYRRIDR